MVFEIISIDKEIIKRRVAVEINMKAQTYQGHQLLPSKESFYVCGYNNPADIATAIDAMEALKI